MNLPRAVLLVPLVLLLMPSGPFAAQDWHQTMDRAEILLSHGKADSASNLVYETISGLRCEHSLSDTGVTVYVYRHGLLTGYCFGSYIEAESLYTRALAITQTISGPRSAEYAALLNDLAEIYRFQLRRGESDSLHHEALSIREEALGHVSLEVAESLFNLALLYWGQRRNAETEELAREALAIREEIHGHEHPEVAHTLRVLAWLAYGRGQYAEAESLAMEALAIWDTVLGPDNLEAVRFLDCLGQISIRMGHFASAETLYLRAADLGRGDAGPSQLEKSLSKLGEIYSVLGRYSEAESLYICSLNIYEEKYGRDHYAVTAPLNLLGMLYRQTGRYAEAEAVVRRSLEIREAQRGPDSREAARVANTLANVCLSQGRYAEAEHLYKRAIAVGEAGGSGSQQELAVYLYNLALIYRDQSAYTEAELLFRRARAIWEDLHGPDHYDVGGACIELAELCRETGRPAEAESLYDRAIAIADATFGPGSEDAARSYQGLGDVYLDRGLYAEAESYLGRALAIRESDPGAASEETPRTLESLARLHRLRGDPGEALDLAARAVAMRNHTFTDNAYALSERDALAASRFLRTSVDLYLSCYSDLSSPDEVLSRDLGDVVFASKGRISDRIFERRRSIVDETDPVILDLAERLRIAKFQLSGLFVEGPGDDAQTYAARVDSLTILANRLESDLSRASASYRERRESRNISAGKLAALLPEGAVLVEYDRYSYVEPNLSRSVPRYLVLALSRDGLEAVVELGEAAEIDAIVEEWRGHMQRVASSGHMPGIIDRQEYDALASDLYDRIWKPVEPCFDDAGLVMVAPDGALNLLAFGGLKGPEGHYLIERHAIHYLSAGRDLVRLGSDFEPAAGLLAMGDPDYGALPGERVAALEAATDSVVQLASVDLNLRSACGELGEIELNPLPGTRHEVDLASARWSETTSEPVEVCYGREASEEYLKMEAPGRRVIHLATHGYFLGGACAPQDANARYVGENPLLLSGLFLAGAGLHGESENGLWAEDGILTAYEVSAMDLTGTELVVLSACETGVGKLADGEGVYGLRRAFQMAGARTVVSALWPVSDAATAEMMGRLYMRSDETLPEAIRRIQLEKIEELRSGGGADHPFTWGAFIALGDWR